MKRVLAVLLLAVMMLTLFAACGKKMDCEICGKERRCTEEKVLGDETAWICGECKGELEELNDALGDLADSIG